MTDAELEQSRPLGRPRLPEGERREQITMRRSRETIDALKARGPGCTNFAEEAVKRALKNVDVFAVTDTVRRYVEIKTPVKVNKKNAVTLKVTKRAQPKAAKDRSPHAARGRS